MNKKMNCWTAVIPIRIDSDERLRNLLCIINYLQKTDCKIILLEADIRAKIDKTIIPKNVDYHYVTPIFHRTKYINTLLEYSCTDVVAVWDADVFVPYRQIYDVLDLIENKGCTLAYPYNGTFITLNETYTDKVLNGVFPIEILEKEYLRPLISRPSCGGVFFVNKGSYKSIGGENERFYGWGPEDAERLRRVQIMQKKVLFLEYGRAYHLYHPRLQNSKYFNDNVADNLRKEFIKICCMNKEELSNYIDLELKREYNHKK